MRIDNETYIIYALIDPRSYETRYVGLTRVGYNRFMQHLNKEGKNHRKNGWIQELEDLGEMAIFEVLDKANSLALAEQKEAYWIHVYRSKLFNRDIPELILPPATSQAPAHIQIFAPLEDLEWALIEMQNRSGGHILGHAITVEGCGVHKHANMASYHFHIDINSLYVYAVRRWAKRAFQDHIITGYRFALKGVEWATFGDAEAIRRCEEEEMKWVILSSKPGTEDWNIPINIPSRDVSGNLIYNESSHGVRFLGDAYH